MIEYKASTKRGQELIKMGYRCRYKQLNQLYKSWSQAKQQAFDRCFGQYVNEEHSKGFRIGNANSFSFTCCWLSIKDGENIMHIETKNNSYLVWLDR